MANESVRLSVCLCVFEDVSQNSFKHSKRPTPLKIGLISKSLLNKRKREKNALRIYFWCLGYENVLRGQVLQISCTKAKM